jgi:DNA polymerase-3 subunit gamma/tau
VLGVRWTVRAVADGGNGGGGAPTPRRAPDPKPEPLRSVESAPAAQPDGDDDWPAVRPVLRSVPDEPAHDDVPPPPPPEDYDGFDPGDEPMDDPAPADDAPRRDPEAEAVALLQQQLGARKIGEL